MLLVTLLALIIGILLANVIGSYVVNIGLSVSGLGLKEMRLIPDLLVSLLTYPATLIIVVTVVSIIVIRNINRYNLVSLVKKGN